MQFTILVVDDDPTSIKIISSLLTDDYRVLMAKSGAKALQIAETEQPDLILLDVLMPDLDGFAVIKQLKANDNTKAIPVIFVTALDSQSDEEQGLKLGAVDYIQKPFHQGIVLARVKNQLELIRHKRLLEQLVNLDALTELPNRRKWKNDSEMMWHRAQSEQSFLAIGILDVDYFKLYNDHYGHTMGDVALQKVATGVREYLSQQGGNLYRFGGEEFVFVMVDPDKAVLERHLNQLCAQVLELGIKHKNSPINDLLTISAGICLMQVDDTISVRRMLESADEHLYKVKEQGRNQIAITTEIQERRKSQQSHFSDF